METKMLIEKAKKYNAMTADQLKAELAYLNERIAWAQEQIEYHAEGQFLDIQTRTARAVKSLEEIVYNYASNTERLREAKEVISRLAGAVANYGHDGKSLYQQEIDYSQTLKAMVYAMLTVYGEGYGPIE